MTWREAGRLNKGELEVLIPGRLGIHWLTQVGAYLAAAGPLGVKLVPQVVEGNWENLSMDKGNEEDIMISGRLERHLCI